MLSQKKKIILLKSNCFIIKRNKIWRFSNAFFQKTDYSKIKKYCIDV